MEANNNAMLREAVESIADNLERRLFAKYPSSATDEWMWQKANSALANPPRNCDVGTAEEQFERWHAFCDSYDKDCTGCPCDGPVLSMAYCFSNWAQMPYKEGEMSNNAYRFTGGEKKDGNH